MSAPVSEIFDPAAWSEVPGFDFTDITYHRANDVGAVRIAFDRPGRLPLGQAPPQPAGRA